ncbi:Uncharacterised protein [Streptococcus vestibularis]|uniref:Uncharacterized protein n=1 Tax=Streptococcus vestibularis TaxID=1343 RepID=A0A564TKJ7_STRVE|nr:Uncharacterised protein [Streptococcus vestibularis]
MVLFLVGVAVTLSISTIYFTKQGKKAGEYIGKKHPVR